MADFLILVFIVISATVTLYLGYRFLKFKYKPEENVFTSDMLRVFLIAIVLMFAALHYYFKADAIISSPHLFAIDNKEKLFNLILSFVVVDIIVIGIVYSFCKAKNIDQFDKKIKIAMPIGFLHRQFCQKQVF